MDRRGPTTESRARWPVFPVAAGLGLLAYGAMVVVDLRTGTLRADSTPSTIAFYLAAFVSYLAVIWSVERSRGRYRPPGRWLWALPILFRLLLLATDPTLSDDVYRYLWDGHVLTGGVNPYSYAVSAAELDHLDIPIRSLVNNPDLATPYLPTTQLLFAALALGAPSTPLTMQTVMVLFDIGVAVVLARLLPLAGLPARRAMLYVWNPLVIVETAHGAHFDSLLTLLSIAAVLTAFDPAWNRGRSGDGRSGGGRSGAGRFGGPRRFASPVLLSLAVLTRPIPLLLLPVLWWRWGWAQRLTAVVTMSALLAPFGFGRSGLGLGDANDGTGLFGSARVYGTEFRFNAVVAPWIEQRLESLTGDGAGAATVVIALLLSALLGVVGLLSRGAPATGAAGVRVQLRLLSVPLLGYVVLTPVLHPWYLVLPVATAVLLAPARFEGTGRWWLLAPLGYLSAAAPLSYLTYLDPDSFGELDWVKRLEWYPTLAVLAILALTAVIAGNRRSADRPGSIGAAPPC